MPTTDAFQDLIINHFLRNSSQTPVATVYISLSTTTPVEAGTNFTEPTGITRQSITLGAPSAGSSTNSNAISFSNNSGGSWTVIAMGLWSASTSGTLYIYKTMAARTINNGETATWAIADLAATFT